LEGEDIYNLMVRYVPTLYKRLSSPGVSTSKGNREDYDKFFDQVLPKVRIDEERSDDFILIAQ